MNKIVKIIFSKDTLLTVVLILIVAHLIILFFKPIKLQVSHKGRALMEYKEKSAIKSLLQDKRY